MVVRNSLCVIIHSSLNLHQFVSHSDILNHRFPSFMSPVSAPVHVLRISQGKWLILPQHWLCFKSLLVCELNFFMIHSNMIDDTTEKLQI